MADKSSRREFLQNASLAGAALVAGGAALTVAGCNPTSNTTTPSTTPSPPQVHIDSAGILWVDDAVVAQQLYEWLTTQGLLNLNPSGSEDTIPCKGIVVSFKKPGGGVGEFKVNSLCAC